MNQQVKEQPFTHVTEVNGQSLEANGQSLTQLTILVSYSGSGGVEVITNHLVQGLVNADIQVELLLLKARGPHIDKMPEHPGLTVTKLKAKLDEDGASSLLWPEMCMIFGVRWVTQSCDRGATSRVKQSPA